MAFELFALSQGVARSCFPSRDSSHAIPVASFTVALGGVEGICH